MIAINRCQINASDTNRTEMSKRSSAGMEKAAFKKNRNKIVIIINNWP